MTRTIIKGGTALNGPATTADFARLDVLVEGGKISTMAPSPVAALIT